MISDKVKKRKLGGHLPNFRDIYDGDVKDHNENLIKLNKIAININLSQIPRYLKKSALGKKGSSEYKSLIKLLLIFHFLKDYIKLNYYKFIL